MLNDRMRRAIFMEVHRAIEDAAVQAAGVLSGACSPDVLSYPPNAGLSDAESAVLRQGPVPPALVPVIRKVVADAAAQSVFRLLSLIDGVADPESWRGTWPPLDLSPVKGDVDSPMLHDELFETYWAWVEARPERKWRLDLASGDQQGEPD